jgi:hypothetical protein
MDPLAEQSGTPIDRVCEKAGAAAEDKSDFKVGFVVVDALEDARTDVSNVETAL